MDCNFGGLCYSAMDSNFIGSIMDYNFGGSCYSGMDCNFGGLCYSAMDYNFGGLCYSGMVALIIDYIKIVSRIFS
jgi:hypothetical protein